MSTSLKDSFSTFRKYFWKHLKVEKSNCLKKYYKPKRNKISLL